MENTRFRSGVPKTPKFERWASPQSCTWNPERGVAARSEAMISAPPRKKVNGETSIRPYRMGKSSGTRVAACCSSSSIGSGRPGAGAQSACDARGTSARAALPRSARSAADRCTTRPTDAARFAAELTCGSGRIGVASWRTTISNLPRCGSCPHEILARKRRRVPDIERIPTCPRQRNLIVPAAARPHPRRVTSRPNPTGQPPSLSDEARWVSRARSTLVVSSPQPLVVAISQGDLGDLDAALA